MYDYSKMIAVSNRHVFDAAPDSEAAFLMQLEKVVCLQPRALVLREKDLSLDEYRVLAGKVLHLFSRDRLSAKSSGAVKTELILHKYWEAALELGVSKIHLPLGMLTGLHDAQPDILRIFDLVGTSVHSVDEALTAVRCGAAYLFAGNVYETTCKPGLEGRGLKYLREVAHSVDIPVYGIGGISEEKMPEVLAQGAAGGCMMSGFMNL